MGLRLGRQSGNYRRRLLTINENKTSQTAAIRFMAEGTQGLLKVGSNASVTAYKSAGENTYSAAFVSTISSTFPSQVIWKQSLP